MKKHKVTALLCLALGLWFSAELIQRPDPSEAVTAFPSGTPSATQSGTPEPEGGDLQELPLIVKFEPTPLSDSALIEISELTLENEKLKLELDSIATERKDRLQWYVETLPSYCLTVLIDPKESSQREYIKTLHPFLAKGWFVQIHDASRHPEITEWYGADYNLPYTVVTENGEPVIEGVAIPFDKLSERCYGRFSHPYNQQAQSKDAELYYFTASWCINCKKTTPIVKEFQAAGWPIVTVSLDDESTQKFAEEVGGTAPPTFVSMKTQNGKRVVVRRSVGVPKTTTTSDLLVQMLDELLGR